MDRKEISTNQAKTRWFIDLDWFQQNNRSFSALAQSRLCAKCRKQANAEVKEISTADLLSAIKGCCANDSGFITGQLPVLESVFRLFLANGNQPLDLEELAKQLSERRDGDVYCTSLDILPHLLESDQYYGLRPIPD